MFAPHSRGFTNDFSYQARICSIDRSVGARTKLQLDVASAIPLALLSSSTEAWAKSLVHPRPCMEEVMASGRLLELRDGQRWLRRFLIKSCPKHQIKSIQLFVRS